MSHESSSSSFDFYYSSASLPYSLITNTPIAEKMTVDIRNVSHHTDPRQTRPQIVAVAVVVAAAAGIATVSTTETTTTITTNVK